MKYLTKDDFIEIVANAVNPVHFSIEQYYLFQYNNHKSVNPDFVSNLKSTIDLITSHVEFHASLSVDYPKNYNWNEHLIYYKGHSFKVLEYEYKIRETALDNKIADLYSDGYAPTTINELRMSFNRFKTLIKKDFIKEAKTKDAVSPALIKLQWKGQNNQLYYVFRQLKKKYMMLDETYDVLTSFIQQSFVGFDEIKKSGIEKEIKKNLDNPDNMSKQKRLPIKIDEEQE